MVLHMAVCGADVDLVPRDVRMAEDHDICLWEPAAETGGSALSRTAVVDGRNFTSAEFDDESLGQDHAAVVVSEHRPNWRRHPWR